jgi:hypothetical protein
MLRFDYRWLACLASTLILAGCGGGSDPDRLDTVSAGGTVTYNGVPVEGASVTFMPQSEDGHGAVGTTDEEGHFELTTYEPGDGAVVGDYKVKITKIEAQGALSQEEAQAYEEKGQTPPPIRAKSDLPLQYANPDTSGLTQEVKEDADENDFTFALTD